MIPKPLIRTITVITVMAVLGVPIEKLLIPVLWGCFLTLAIAWMLGARAVVEKCVSTGITLIIGITIWPGLSYQVREFVHGLTGASGAGPVIVAVLVLIVLIGIVYVAGKAWLLAPKKERLPRPTLRHREPSIEPRSLPRYGDSSRSGRRSPSEDDLDLFGRGR